MDPSRKRRDSPGTDPDTVRVVECDIFPEGSAGSGRNDTFGHYNAYAEASQAREIGRKRYNTDLKHSAESDPVIKNDAKREIETSEPTAATNIDRSVVEAMPIEVRLPSPDDSVQQKDTTSIPRLMRVEEVAAYLGMSVSKVWRLPSKDPDFPRPIRIGGSTRWDRSEIDRFVDVSKARRHTDR